MAAPACAAGTAEFSSGFLNIDYVVIMGQQTNCCVRCTAIGAEDVDRQTHPGLAQNGIRVLSALDLLYSTEPAADFHDDPMVEIYRHV